MIVVVPERALEQLDPRRSLLARCGRGVCTLPLFRNPACHWQRGPPVESSPGLRRYTISRNARPMRGGDPYYLVAELDWDDIEALQRDFRSPEGQATAADVAKLAPEGKVRTMIYELEEV